MRESTRGSSKKIYGYEASRLKLKEPQKLVIKDKDSGKKKVIVYYYRNKIKKVKVPEHLLELTKGGKNTAKNAKKPKKSVSGSKTSKKAEMKNSKKSGKQMNKKSANKKSTGSKSQASKKSVEA